MTQHSRNNTIGLIGLGLVGTALASRFQQARFRVVGYDISAERCKALQENNVEILSSPADVSSRTNRIVLSLTDSKAVQDVLFGDRGILSAPVENLLIVDTTTGDPDKTVETAQKIREKNGCYTDACIIGSSKMVSEGKAVIVMGASQNAVEQSQDILSAITDQVFHVGEAGKGSQAKLVVNLVIGLHRLVLSEGLVLAESLGLDLENILNLLKSGVSYSRVMDTKGKKMIHKHFEPEARLKQHKKDVGLILEMSRNYGVSLPLSELHEQILSKGIEAGLGELDNSAVIEILRKRADNLTG